jgi:choline dehydrogenase-like flavoprotein
MSHRSPAGFSRHMSDGLPASARADVVIIGTGIGGSTLAYALRETSRSVLVLERGPYLPREADNWSSAAVFSDLKYRTTDRWVDWRGRAFRPEMQHYVGGNSKFYGGVLWRLRPSDFGPQIHVDGESASWPIGYQDLEPYYSLAENITVCVAQLASIRPSRLTPRRMNTRRWSTIRRWRDWLPGSASKGFARSSPRSLSGTAMAAGAFGARLATDSRAGSTPRETLRSGVCVRR